MVRKTTRAALFLLVGAFGLLPLFALFPARVAAADNCTVSASDFSLAFTNRAVITGQYKGSATCLTLNGKSVTANPKGMFSGSYVDQNIDDSDYNYTLRNGASDSQISAVLDNFADGLDNNVKDIFGGRDTPISAATLSSLISSRQANLKILYPTSKLQNSGCSNTYVKLESSGSWTCQSGTEGSGIPASKLITSLDNFNVLYNVYGTGDNITIKHVSPGQAATRTFVWCKQLNNGAGRFQSENCTGDLYLDGLTLDAAKEYASGGSKASQNIQITIKSDAKAGSINIFAAGSNTASAKTDTSVYKGGNDANGNTSSGNDSKDCEGVRGIAWIVCPFIDGAYNFLASVMGPDGKGGATSMFASLLITRPLNHADDGTKIMRQVWASFRTMANVGFVIVLLIIVFGQATGFVDAYTIKKALPRLVIAIILVQLSYFICGLIVDIFNILGAGVAGLILAPVQGMRAFSFNATWLDAAFATAGGLAFGAGILLKGSAIIHGLSVILVGAIVSVLVALLTIIFRKILITMLIVFSPIAFVCMVLPGTEKIYKEWIEWFTKTLLMYPLIVAFIASGRLVGTLIANSGGDAGSSIISLVANFAPFFLIPFTFQFAGSAIANATGIFDKTLGKMKGDPRNPGSWRYKRMQRANMLDMNRRAKYVRKYGAADKFDTGRLGRLGGWAGHWAARGVSRFGYNIDQAESRLNAQFKEEMGLLGLQYGGEDSDYWSAIMGSDKNLITGNDISKDILNATKRYHKNPHATQAAMTNLFDKSKGLRGYDKDGKATGYGGELDLMDHFDRMAGSDGRKYTSQQRMAMVTGMAFGRQHVQPHFKYLRNPLEEGASSAIDYAASESGIEMSDEERDVAKRFGGFSEKQGNVGGFMEETMGSDMRGINIMGGNTRKTVWNTMQAGLKRETAHAVMLDRALAEQKAGVKGSGYEYLRRLQSQKDSKGEATLKGENAVLRGDNSINEKAVQAQLTNAKKNISSIYNYQNTIAGAVQQAGTYRDGDQQKVDYEAGLQSYGANYQAAEAFAKFHHNTTEGNLGKSIDSLFKKGNP